MSHIIKQLRDIMVGKRIIAVREPVGNDAIVRFVMEDGATFQLHLTETGISVDEMRTRTGRR